LWLLLACLYPLLEVTSWSKYDAICSKSALKGFELLSNVLVFVNSLSYFGLNVRTWKHTIIKALVPKLQWRQRLEEVFESCICNNVYGSELDEQ
jgi:hypothetical protein